MLDDSLSNSKVYPTGPRGCNRSSDILMSDGALSWARSASSTLGRGTCSKKASTADSLMGSGQYREA